jgi:hypothetical protein
MEGQHLLSAKHHEEARVIAKQKHGFTQGSKETCNHSK